VFCVVFGCSLNFLLLAAPIYMTQVYDRVLSGNNLYMPAMLTVAVGPAYLSQSALDAVRSRLMTRAGNAFEHSLRRAVFQAELAEPADRRSGGGGQSARDMEQVRAFLTGAPTMALMDAPWTPLFILAPALIHPLSAVLTVGGMVALIVLALINESLVAGQTREANIAAAEAQSFFDSALRNAYAVKAMGMPDALIARREINLAAPIGRRPCAVGGNRPPGRRRAAGVEPRPVGRPDRLSAAGRRPVHRHDPRQHRAFSGRLAGNRSGGGA
jgi:ABC-type protease/lipase transport system fused ATPase/permease subunit